MKAITLSDFRSNLKSLLNKVSDDSEIIMIRRSDREEDAVVVMSIAEYNSIKETEYLLSSEENRKRLREALKEAERGETRAVDLSSLG